MFPCRFDKQSSPFCIDAGGFFTLKSHKSIRLLDTLCLSLSMRRETLPVKRLALWARFNSVDFNGVEISSLDDRGSGITATWDSGDSAILVNVPKDLILSLENMWNYARSDKHLLQALEAVGEYATVRLLKWKLFIWTNRN